MNEQDLPWFISMLESFRHRGGTRGQQDLLLLDLHDLVNWCRAHPESVEVRVGEVPSDA